MNIFAIEGRKDNVDFVKSAQSLDNLRVVKMIVESCQILSTAMWNNGVPAPYKPTHTNHPCVKWATESYVNFFNLAVHAEALLAEYNRRFGKIHKCENVLRDIMLNANSDRFTIRANTPLPLCMPEEFIVTGDTVESYRRYYASKPNIRYRTADIPSWFRAYRGDMPFVEV